MNSSSVYYSYYTRNSYESCFSFSSTTRSMKRTPQFFLKHRHSTTNPVPISFPTNGNKQSASSASVMGIMGMTLRRQQLLFLLAMPPPKGTSSFTSLNRRQQDEDDDEEPEKKRGTILGAVSLIVGTSIGSGILALPQKTLPAGFIPSAVAITLCWLFLVIEALLLAEINVHLRKRGKKDTKNNKELEVISLRTMAQEMLGKWGGNLATVTYLFLAYTSIVAYTSKSGEVLSHLINLPNSISGILFTLLLALLILVGGTNITDRVNQWLTITMIGLLVAIEVMGLSLGGLSDSMTISNWREVPQTIPVIIFSLVYHDIVPVICAYLGGDLSRVRISILLGSLVPLISLLIWDGIALGFSSNLDGIHHLLFFLRARWSNMFPVVEVFSLLAVGTSLIGTLLGFSQFFTEQLTNVLHSLPSTQGKLRVDTADNLTNDKKSKYIERNWWVGNKLGLLATSMAVFPSIVISVIVPDAFSVATDIAGGYCMTILYGVLPPAMAYAMMHSRRGETKKNIINDKDKVVQVNDDRLVQLSNVNPVLIGVGLLSCGIVMEQLYLDLIQ